MGLRTRFKKLGRTVLGGDPVPRAGTPVPGAAPARAADSAGPATPNVVEGKLLRADGTPYDLVLYKFDSCPYARRVMRCLDELGITVERQDTRQDIEAMRALRDLTGRTQVPCLVIDGTPMLESADIVVWLRARARG